MIDRRPRWMALCWTACCLLVLPLTLSADGDPRRPKARSAYAPPPRWDRATRERFLPDVPARLGPRPTPVAAAAPRAAEDIAAPPPNQAPADAAATASWSAVISAETLEDEIKAVSARLGDALKSATKFKSGGFQQARVEFTWLAVLLEAVSQFDGQVRWQASAAALRDGAARAGRNCKAASDATYKEAKRRAEELGELLRGQRLDGPQAGAGAAWPEIVDRPPLMQRLETVQREALVPATADAAEFRRRRGEVLQMAQVLALLSRVIEHPDYEYSAEESYQAAASELAQAANDISAAAQADHFERVQQAVRRAGQACDNCHTNFRN